MKIKDLGPFAVFRMNGRVYVKSAGMIQRLDRSGTLFDSNFTTTINMEDEVEAVDLTAPRYGQSCLLCFGGGFEPGEWHQSTHGYDKKRCRHGCLVEGLPDMVAEKPVEKVVCECCSQPIIDCERAGLGG